MNTNDIDNNSIENVIGEEKVIKKSKEQVFFAVPNVARAYGTEYYLEDLEMAVLVQIGVNVSAWDTSITKTSIDMLNEELKVDVKNKCRGRESVEIAIKSLEEKGYIKIDSNDDKIENTSFLVIHILNDLNEVKVSQEGTTFSGFVPVTKRILRLAKKGNPKPRKFGQRLKVLTHIVWRSGIETKFTKKYSISFDEWKNVLKVAHSTAKNAIKTLEKEGIIEILHGEYKRNADGLLYFAEDGKPRQERNTYFLAGDKPEVVEGYRPTVLQKHRREFAIQGMVEQVISEGEPRIAERPQLVMFGSKLEVNDIEIFLTTDSETLVKESRKKFAVVMGGEVKEKREKGRQMLLDWEKEVKELFKGGNEHKIKRSIFNLDNPKLSEHEQKLTPDELKNKVDTFGYDNEYEEDEFAYDFINSVEEEESIRKRAKENFAEKEKIPFYMTEEFINKFANDDESDSIWEQEQQEIDTLPFA